MSKENEHGIVYVLSNRLMPGIVKIGMTQRAQLDSRLKELYTTGVPVPFDVEFACEVEVSDCAKVERALHRAFAPNRINANREFFEIDKQQAIAILELLDKKEITSEVQEEMDNDLEKDDIIAKNRTVRRRPQLNFAKMQIPVGSELVYVKDPNITCVVSSDRKVTYNGEETSLTAVTWGLLNTKYQVQPTPYWTYEGKLLSEIYDETYPLED